VTQTTGSEPIDKPLRDLLEDTSMSARAVAFTSVVLGMLTHKVTYIAQADIESATGMRHEDWPLEQAALLGLVRVSDGQPDDPKGAAGWMATVPAYRGHVCISASVQDDAAVCSTVLVVPMMRSTSVRGNCRTSPTSACWQDLGRYRYDAWLLHCLAPDEEVTTALARRVLGLDARTAQRLLVRLRSSVLLKDGRWHTYAIEALDDDYPTGYRVMAARQRRQHWVIDRERRVSIPSTEFRDGFRRLVSVQEPEVVEGWTLFAAEEHAPVTKSELLAALSERLAARLVAIR